MDFEGYLRGGGEETADFLGVVGCSADYRFGLRVERATDGHVGGRRAVPVNVEKRGYFIGIENQVVASFVIKTECANGFWRHDVVDWKPVLLRIRWAVRNKSFERV